MREIRRSIWEDLQFGGASNSFDQDIEAVQYLEELNRHGREFGVVQKNLTKLRLLKRSPYFGRIDFHDHEFDIIDPIYIGVASLVDQTAKEHLVYDWRAPVASMFYDYGLGPAAYESPGGEITGEILLKRQYKIENGKLISVFDSELTINDDILQDELGRTTDNRMRSIIYSIQREQNQAIRDESAGVLFVQGPAGSGKTSIALHRAAYLLYRYHGALTADNIVIFSPNKIFSDYIHNVLPELGEENIRQATMQEYIDRMISPEWEIEEYYAQFEYLLALDSHSNDPRVAALQFKASTSFFQLIQAYLEYIEGHSFKFTNINAWGEIIITKEQCEHLFHDTYRYLPIKSRLEKIRRRIYYLLKPKRRAKVDLMVKKRSDHIDHIRDSEQELRQACGGIVNKELQTMYRKIDAMLTINSYQLYEEFFSNPNLVRRFSDGKLVPNNWKQICDHTMTSLRERKLLFEDAAPLLYLDGMLSGWSTISSVRHVIVDESQDYSLFNYEILRNIFPKAAFTILGDLDQAIHPYIKLTNYDEVVDNFQVNNSRPKLINLTKSYRSTKEIGKFTRSLLPNLSLVDLVDRSGEKPQVIAAGDQLRELLVEKIIYCLEHGCNSVAVICKTEKEAILAEAILSKEVKVTRLSKNKDRFVPGVVITPVYLGKGLEFDAVLIFDADETIYSQEEERNLFYTACTRALHYLFIFYRNRLTSFITDIDKQLYQLQ